MSLCACDFGVCIINVLGVCACMCAHMLFHEYMYLFVVHAALPVNLEQKML